MNTTNSTQHWASLQETSLLWGIACLVWIYRIFGRWMFRLILRPVVSYYFLTGKIARNASREYLHNLGETFPELALSSGWWQSYRHFLSFGETLLDKIIVWTGNINSNHVDFPQRELLLDLLEQKKGVILLTGHFGNLEICQAIASIRGQIHLNILVHTRHAEKFNRLLGERTGSATIQLIQVTEITPAIAINLQEKIDRGEFIVLVGDRIPVSSTRTVSASFLGKEACFPQGPYLLASLLRCPIYTLFCYRVNEHYHINLEFFAETIRIPRPEQERQQLLKTLAQRYAQRLENLCHDQPLQWFNFFSIWQQTPDLEDTKAGRT